MTLLALRSSCVLSMSQPIPIEEVLTDTYSMIEMPSLDTNWASSVQVAETIRSSLHSYGAEVLSLWPSHYFPISIRFVSGDGLVHIIASVAKDVEQCFAWCSQNGLNFGERNRSGHTPMLAAAFSGNLAAMKCLTTKYKRTPEKEFSTSGGDSALHLAASQGHEAVVTWLLRSREMYRSISSPNLAGRSALMEAVCGGHRTICSLLLKSAGYSRESTLLTQVDGLKQSVFHHVSEEGHVEVLKDLLKVARQHNVRLGFDTRGNSPLSRAVAKNHIEIVKVWTSYYQAFPLGHSNRNAFRSPIDGPLLDCNDSGNDIVLRAASYGSLEVLQHLVNDCEIELWDHKNRKTGESVLQAAAKRSHLLVVSWILERVKMNSTQRRFVNLVEKEIAQLEMSRESDRNVVQFIRLSLLADNEDTSL